MVLVCSDHSVDSDDTLLKGVNFEFLSIFRVSDSWGKFDIVRKVFRQLFIGDGNILFVYRVLSLLMKKQLGIIPDVVFTSSAPYEIHLVGPIVKRAWRSAWIADFRDPYTLNKNYCKRIPLGWWLDKLFEKYIYNKSDGVVFNTVLNREQSIRKFSLSENCKYFVTQNGYDDDDFAGLIEGNANNNYEIAYIGGVRCDGYELDFINQIQVHRDELLAKGVRFAFAGNGSNKLKPYIGGISDLVELRPFLRSDSLIDYWNRADAFLLLLPDSEEKLGWVPQKLYSYMRTQKPVLGILPDGEAKKYLLMNSANVISSPTGYHLPELVDLLIKNKKLQFDTGVYEKFSQDKLFYDLTCWLTER